MTTFVGLNRDYSEIIYGSRRIFDLLFGFVLEKVVESFRGNYTSSFLLQVQDFF